MRGLHGDFATMPLKDVVSYLGNKRASGTLRIERGSVRKQADILDGAVVSTSSTERREFLGQFLINLGRISEEQFEKAYRTQQETQIFLGKILVMIGLVDEQTVTNALSMKARETMLDAFQWTEGTFSFDPTPPEVKPDSVEARLELLDLPREAEFRETAWQVFRGAFPHGRLRLEVDERKLSEPPKPGSHDERLVALIKDGLTIDEMLLAMHATDFFLYQRLYAMYRQDAVKLAPEREPAGDDFDFGEISITEGEPDAAAQAGGGVPDVFDIEESGSGFEARADASTSADEQERLARACLEVGNAKEAEAFARKALELSPSPERTELLRRAEEAFGGQHKAELMDKRRVPSLLVPSQKLKTMGLSAPERYLLSRVDGTRDVSSIVHVSPLQELEALKLFQRFVDSELIRLS